MRTKAPPPHPLPAPELDPIARAYFELSQLKVLYRQGWLRRGIPAETCESVAEHSFGVAFLALMAAGSLFPGLDALKLLRLALIHDAGEALVGDLTPADAVSRAQKHALERDAVEQIFGGLPDGAAYISLWQEYEDGASPEARLVRQLDRLEMGLQASLYERMGYPGLGEFFDSARQGLQAPALRELFAAVEDARR